MLRKIFLENLFWKILSLIFALVLWWFVSTGTTPVEVPKEVPLELRSLSQEMIRTSDLIGKIDIRVSGPRSVVQSIQSEDLMYVLDLSNVQPGPTVYKIYASKIEGMPNGVRVTEISPSQITLFIEERAEKVKPVSIEIKGKPAHGYAVGEMKAEPSLVLISGPKTEIETVKSVSTEVVDLTGAKENVETTAGLDLVGRHLDLVESSEVRVTVEIKPEEITREFTDVPIRLENSVLDFVADPGSLSFKLKGPLLSLEKLKMEEIVLFVDAEGLGPGRHSLRPRVRLPEDTLLLDEGLPKVKVTLKTKKTKKIQSPKKKIR